MTGHWNYRLVLHPAGKFEINPVLKRDRYLAIHETHYNNDGEIENITKNPISVMGDEGGNSLSSIKWILDKMAEALQKPIIDYNTLKEISQEKQNDFSKSIEEKKQNGSKDL